jgi:hypothetical protein
VPRGSLNPSYAGLTRVSIQLRKSLAKQMDCRVKPGNDGVVVAVSAACIQTPADLLISPRAKSFNKGAREIVMAKGQMRSNKEKKKPKADKNIKKGGAAPSPFAAGKTPAGQSPNSKKS